MNVFNPQTDELLARPQVEHIEKDKHEIKHLGTMRHRPGHTLFSFNHTTKEIKRIIPARRAQLGCNGRVKHDNRVTVDQNCYYAEALNERNFIKHLKKHSIIQ